MCLDNLDGVHSSNFCGPCSKRGHNASSGGAGPLDGSVLKNPMNREGPARHPIRRQDSPERASPDFPPPGTGKPNSGILGGPRAAYGAIEAKYSPAARRPSRQVPTNRIFAAVAAGDRGLGEDFGRVPTIGHYATSRGVRPAAQLRR